MDQFSGGSEMNEQAGQARKTWAATVGLICGAFAGFETLNQVFPKELFSKAAADFNAIPFDPVRTTLVLGAAVVAGGVAAGVTYAAMAHASPQQQVVTEVPPATPAKPRLFQI